MTRDDFTEKTKKILAERVGYRCSNPTCGILTVKADPSSPLGSTRAGVAAHITAASSTGPRFNRMLTSQQRKSIENGIWTCQKCGRVIDSAEDAFTEDMLRNWKLEAERRAAREFNATKDGVDQILKAIDDLHICLINFIEKWEKSDPSYDDPWGDLAPRLRHSRDRLNAYQRDIDPKVLNIMTKATATLGKVDPLIVEAQMIVQSAYVNYLAMRALDVYLQKLRAHLSLY